MLHNERSTWTFGDKGERLVFDVLLADGWRLVNTAEASASGAPLLACPADDVILPDVLGFRGTAGAWFEVKSKSDYITYRKANERRHGFEKRCWEHYQQIEAETGLPVYVIVYEKRRKRLLRAKLSELPLVDETTAEQATRDYDGDAVVFFPRSAFGQCVEATRFDGETYVRGEPLADYQGPVLEPRDKINSWAAGGIA